MSLSLHHRIPPILRALLAQGLAFAGLVVLARLGLRFPGPVWMVLQAVGAALLTRLLGLDTRWVVLQAALPCLARALWGLPIPPWVYFVLFTVLALVFGGGLLTRVPLYHASRDAWVKLEALLPETAGFRFVDLGCGFGGPVAHLARTRPDGHFTGIEASPLTWLVAWVRCLALPNATIRLGSLWRTDLAPFSVVYAFLSPVPMPALWTKSIRKWPPAAASSATASKCQGRHPTTPSPRPGGTGHDCSFGSCREQAKTLAEGRGESGGAQRRAEKAKERSFPQQPLPSPRPSARVVLFTSPRDKRRSAARRWWRRSRR